MVKSRYTFIDTPALLIDEAIMQANLQFMQDKARQCQVNLRPHIKTHRMPQLARLQVSMGAAGITAAKVGEAEVMAAEGITDIFIANQIVGKTKLERLKALHSTVRISVGVDNVFQIDELAAVFASEQRPIEVLIEIEVGEVRSGVNTDEELLNLAHYIASQKSVKLQGIFSHEGHCYKAANSQDCLQRAAVSQRRMLQAAQLLRSQGLAIETVSIGSTPSLMQAGIMEGITEIRPGTYIFMDAGQGGALGDYSRCAATVLTTIISTPTAERIVLDAGAKALTSQNRPAGICATEGYGLVKNAAGVRLSGVFDEHGIINSQALQQQLTVGDKIEVIPNHICPTCNLYEKAYLVADGVIKQEIPVLCRGKSQ